jgi:hypothetical protein
LQIESWKQEQGGIVVETFTKDCSLGIQFANFMQVVVTDELVMQDCT